MMRRLRILLLLLLLPVASGAQVSYSISDFEPVGFQFALDGRALEDAEVFQSRAAGAFLIMASDLPAPVVVRLRDGQVVTANLMKINRNDDGTVELLSDFALAPQGAFKLTPDRSGVEFAVEGRAASLKEKPPLLGLQNIAGLEEHSPEYRRSAEAYRPSGPIVGKLRDQSQDIQVTVYFGSWCGACKQMVPRIMKVAEQLAGSKVKFDFYGLPPGIEGDPEAGKVGVHSVPTGVIYVDGEEVGRIEGAGWKVPELALNNLLVDSSS
jgi:thiol-disulfide isomerase/thioredoxin